MQESPRNPVVLIHGIDDTHEIFWRMMPYLEQRGWETHGLDLYPNNGRLGLDVLAKQVADYVENTFAPNQAIDLVGFSMGGIISRYYVQRLGGIQRVQRFVTIASPHCGTFTAYIRNNTGAKQMCPKSAFLQDLNQDVQTLEQINFTSIWTPWDAMIVPASSSQLPVGKDLQVWIAAHAWMVTDPKGIKAVAATLAEPLRNHSISHFTNHSTNKV